MRTQSLRRAERRRVQTRLEAPPLGPRQHSAPSQPIARATSFVPMPERPYQNKPNLGTHTYAAGARNAQIQDLAEKLKREVSPGGLYGIAYGAGIGASAATAISFAVSFLTLLTPVLPGLGAGLFVGIFLASTLIGAIIQYRARKANMNRPEVRLLAEQLEQFEQELLAIPKTERNGADLRDLRKVQALKVHMSWTFKQGLRQMGYGILGVQPYAKTEECCAAQVKKVAKLAHRSKAAPAKTE